LTERFARPPTNFIDQLNGRLAIKGLGIEQFVVAHRHVGGSGADEDTAASERLVDHRAWNIAPLVDVTSADDNDVEGNFKAAQLTTQTSRLSSALRDLSRLNDEQVEVAVRAGLAAGARAEEDHLRSGCRPGQSPTSLLDQPLVRHEIKLEDRGLCIRPEDLLHRRDHLSLGGAGAGGSDDRRHQILLGGRGSLELGEGALDRGTVALGAGRG
jgi:hypothetical protein